MKMLGSVISSLQKFVPESSWKYISFIIMLFHAVGLRMRSLNYVRSRAGLHAGAREAASRSYP